MEGLLDPIYFLIITWRVKRGLLLGSLEYLLLISFPPLKGELRGGSYSLVYLEVSVYRAYGLAYHRDLSFSRGKGINIFLQPRGIVFGISYGMFHKAF